MRHLVIIACLLLLSGCAERWVKPGATDYDFENLRSVCADHSMKKFPPVIRQVVVRDAYREPLVTDCQDRRHGTTCTTTGGEIVPPTYGEVDDNATARAGEMRRCYYANGWVPAKD